MEEEIIIHGKFEKQSDSLIIKYWHACELFLHAQNCQLICRYQNKSGRMVTKSMDLRGAKIEIDPSSDCVFYVVSALALNKWIFNHVATGDELESLDSLVSRLQSISKSAPCPQKVSDEKGDMDTETKKSMVEEGTFHCGVDMSEKQPTAPTSSTKKLHRIPNRRLYLGLKEYFKPKSYDPIPYPEALKRPYFPRPWLDEEISTFVIQSNESSIKSNVFLLQAERGTGKTTFLQHFADKAKENGELLASVFFNAYHGKEELTVKNVIISLLFQFVEHVSSTNAAICYDRLMKLMKQDHHDNHFHVQNTYQLFLDMILFPLNLMSFEQQQHQHKDTNKSLDEESSKSTTTANVSTRATESLEPPKFMYFIIDGLDEIRSVTIRESLIQFFTFHVFSRCPKWIKFIVSTDRAPTAHSEIPYWLESFQPYSISAVDPRYGTDGKALIDTIVRALIPFPIARGEDGIESEGMKFSNAEESTQYDQLVSLLHAKATFAPSIHPEKVKEVKESKKKNAAFDSSISTCKYQVQSTSPFLYCSLIAEELSAIQSKLSLHYGACSAGEDFNHWKSIIEDFLIDLPNGVDEAYSMSFHSLAASMEKMEDMAIQKAFPLFLRLMVGCYTSPTHEMLQSLLQLSNDHFETLMNKLQPYFPLCPTTTSPQITGPNSTVTTWKVGIIDVQPGDSVTPTKLPENKKQGEGEEVEEDVVESSPNEEVVVNQGQSSKMVTIAPTVTVIVNDDNATNSTVSVTPLTIIGNNRASWKIYPLHSSTFLEWFHKKIAWYEKRCEYIKKHTQPGKWKLKRNSANSLVIDWIEGIVPDQASDVHQYVCEVFLCSLLDFPPLKSFFDSSDVIVSPSTPPPLSLSSIVQIRQLITEQISSLSPHISTASAPRKPSVLSKSPQLQSYLYTYLLDHLDDAGYASFTYIFFTSFVWLSNSLYLRGIHKILTDISMRYQQIQWMEQQFCIRKSLKLLYQFIRLLTQSDASFPLAFTHFHTSGDGHDGFFSSSSGSIPLVASDTNQQDQESGMTMDKHMYEALCRELALQVIARLTAIINNPSTSIGNNQDGIYQLVKEAAKWVDLHGGYLPLGVGTGGGAVNQNIGWKAPGYRIFTSLTESNHYHTREVHIIPSPLTSRRKYQPIPSSYRVLSLTETFLKHSLVRVWDAITGETVVLNKYPFLLYTIHILSDRMLAIGMMDYVRIVNIMTNRLIISLTPKLPGYAAKHILSYVKDHHGNNNTFLAVGFVDEINKQSVIVVWNINSETIVSQCEIAGVLTGMILLPKISSIVFSCDHDKQLHAFSLKIFSILYQKHYEHDVLFRTFCRWNDDSVVIATNHVLTLLNVATMTVRRRVNVIQVPGSMSNSAIFISSLKQVTNEVVAAGNTNGEVFLCNMFNGQKTAHWKAHMDRVTCLCLLQCHRVDIDWDSDDEEMIEDIELEPDDQEVVDKETVDVEQSNATEEQDIELIITEDDLRHPSEIRMSVQLDNGNDQESQHDTGSKPVAQKPPPAAIPSSDKPSQQQSNTPDELAQGLHMLITCSSMDYFLHVWVIQDSYLVPTSALTMNGSTHGGMASPSSHGDDDSSALSIPMGSISILQEFSDSQFLTASNSTTRLWNIREHQLHCTKVIRGCKGVSCVLEVDQHYYQTPPPSDHEMSSESEPSSVKSNTSTQSTATRRRSKLIAEFFSSSLHPRQKASSAVQLTGNTNSDKPAPDYCDIIIGTQRQLGLYNTATGQCDLKLDEDNIHLSPHSIPHANRKAGGPSTSSIIAELLKKKQNHMITTVAQSKGHRIISGSMNGNIHIYNREWYKQLFHATMGDRIECQGHTARITCIVVTKEGNMITSAADGTIRIWDKQKKYACVYKFPCKLYGFGYPTKLMLLYESEHEGHEDDFIGGNSAKTTTSMKKSILPAHKKIIAIENMDGRIGLWYYDTTINGTGSVATGNITLSTRGFSLKNNTTTPAAAMGGRSAATTAATSFAATLSYEMYTFLRKGHLLHHDSQHDKLYILSYDHSVLFIVSVFLPTSTTAASVSPATTSTDNPAENIEYYQRIDLTPNMVYTMMKEHAYPTNLYLLAAKASTNSNIFSSASLSSEHQDVISMFTTSSTTKKAMANSMMSLIRKKGISMMQYPPFSIDEQYVGYFVTLDSQYMIVTGEGGRTLYIVRIVPPKDESNTTPPHHPQPHPPMPPAESSASASTHTYGKWLRHEDVPLFTPSKPMKR